MAVRSRRAVRVPIDTDDPGVSPDLKRALLEHEANRARTPQEKKQEFQQGLPSVPKSVTALELKSTKPWGDRAVIANVEIKVQTDSGEVTVTGPMQVQFSKQNALGPYGWAQVYLGGTSLTGTMDWNKTEITPPAASKSIRHNKTALKTLVRQFIAQDREGVVEKLKQLTSPGGTQASRRMDIPQNSRRRASDTDQWGDMGEENEIFHTDSLPQTGHDEAIDDAQQDIRSASREMKKLAGTIRKISPPLARRMSVLANTINIRVANIGIQEGKTPNFKEDFSTELLEEPAQDGTALDDNNTPGELRFFGTQPPTSDQVGPRKRASRRRASGDLQAALAELKEMVEAVPMKDFYEADDNEDPAQAISWLVERAAEEHQVDETALMEAFQATPDWKAFVQDSQDVIREMRPPRQSSRRRSSDEGGSEPEPEQPGMTTTPKKPATPKTQGGKKPPIESITMKFRRDSSRRRADPLPEFKDDMNNLVDGIDETEYDGHEEEYHGLRDELTDLEQVAEEAVTTGMEYAGSAGAGDQMNSPLPTASRRKGAGVTYQNAADLSKAVKGMGATTAEQAFTKLNGAQYMGKPLSVDDIRKAMPPGTQPTGSRRRAMGDPDDPLSWGKYEGVQKKLMMYQGEEVQILAMKKGGKNARIQLRDGTNKLVPIHELKPMPGGKMGSRRAANHVWESLLNKIGSQVDRTIPDGTVQWDADADAEKTSVETSNYEAAELWGKLLEQAGVKVIAVHENHVDCWALSSESGPQASKYERSVKKATASRRAKIRSAYRVASTKYVSPWKVLKSALNRAGRNGGRWASGAWETRTEDFGRTVDLNLDTTDESGAALVAGSVTFSLLRDNPKTRKATIEVSDGVKYHETREVELDARQASLFAQEWANEVEKTAKEVLNGKA